MTAEVQEHCLLDPEVAGISTVSPKIRVEKHVWATNTFPFNITFMTAGVETTTLR